MNVQKSTVIPARDGDVTPVIVIVGGELPTDTVALVQPNGGYEDSDVILMDDTQLFTLAVGYLRAISYTIVKQGEVLN